MCVIVKIMLQKTYVVTCFCRRLVSSYSAKNTEKAVSKLPGDSTHKLNLKADSPPVPSTAKLLRIAIIGAPNSGKSTLINQLLRWKVFAASKKVHTTRKNALGIYTKGNTQLVFLDTPGIIPLKAARRIKLEKSMLLDPHASLSHADIVGVLVDISNRWSRDALDIELLKVLHLNPNLVSVLILNKVDILKDKVALLSAIRNLTEGVVGGSPLCATKPKKTQPNPCDLLNNLEKQNKIIEESQDSFDIKNISNSDSYHKWLNMNLHDGKSKVECDENSSRELKKDMRQLHELVRDKKGWQNFSDVFMVSALTGDGIVRLQDYFLSQAKHRDWLYHSSLVTNQAPTEMAKQFVWEKFMDRLPNEVPYNLELQVVFWKLDETIDLLKIVMDVICYSPRYYKLVLGEKGSTIKAVAADAKQELLNAFRTDILFKLQAKLVEKN